MKNYYTKGAIDLEENDFPLISVIIPCRNEEKFISGCLDSILNQNYPMDRIEVIVVDGMSDDRTIDIVGDYVKRFKNIKIIKNEKRITPVAMNIGIKNAIGEYIVIINAHSMIDKNFLVNGIKYMKSTGATAVGGRLNTIVDSKTIFSEAIPLAVDSIFGAGGKRYRKSEIEGFVNDTLPYCIYNRDVFEKYGMIDEDLIRGQDAEFNYRIIRMGGKIYYTPKIKSLLYIRPTLKKLFKQHFQYGYFRVLISKKVGLLSMIKQLIPGVFVTLLILTLIGSIFNKFFLWLFLFIFGVYLFVNLLSSVFVALKNEFKYVFVLPFCYMALHFGYGLGFLKGIFDFLIVKKENIKDISLTR